MTKPLKILLVEDSDDDALLLARRLKRAGYALNMRRVDDGESMARALEDDEWDLALCDHSMPRFSIHSALGLIKESGLDLPLIIVSGAIDEKSAVEAMVSGARDYVMKGSLDRLVPVIERELFSKVIRAEKKEAEKALADQLLFLQDLVETIPVPLFYKNTDGVYLGCNKSFADGLGMTQADEIKGRVITDFLSPEQAYRHEQMDQELLKNGGQTIYETSMDYSGGERRHFIAHKAAFSDGQGNPAGIVGVLLDITDLKEVEEKRKELEGQLRQAQKLEAIGTLAGGIAHDFNNILAAIIGYSELAQEQSRLVEHHKITNYLDRVLAASDRARGLIKQILTFSRRTEHEVIPVNVGMIAKEALKLLRASLPPTINMEVNIDPDAGMVSADPTHIHQILMNLCTNASHAMKEKGGQLSVETRMVELQEDELDGEWTTRPGTYLELKVTDTGRGMLPVTQERIFDPYFTTKPPGEGTGLGLSVVHGIIAGMGGSITVRSELGKGSSFKILMPAVDEKDDFAESDPSVLPRGSERVMLVDDEITITEILSNQLETLGYRVNAFSNGDEAWEYYKNNPNQFDVLITDYLMPGMESKELIKRVREIDGEIPIIIYTGLGECLTDDDQRQYGVDALCIKPMNTADLAGTLRDLLDKRHDG